MPARSASVRLRALLLLFVLVPLAACDNGGGPPSPDLLIRSGVSFQRLFSEPTTAEIQAVRADWAARNPSATNATVVASGAFEGSTIYVVSHTMTEGPGAPFTHYGLVRIPDGVGPNAPVLVIHHGGDNGFAVRDAGGSRSANGAVEAFVDVFPTLSEETIQVVPTYRAETMLAGAAGLDAEYASGGSQSPWDYDVDDSIAFLSAALALFPNETDANRIAAVGFSRGANVALLHQIRDDRIDAVTEYYGPSDFYNGSAQQLGIALLLGLDSALGLPGAQYLLDEVFRPLQGPGESYNADADYASARLEVVRRSASLFKADLTNVQIHHHQADPVVPYAFSQAFDARAGAVAGNYEFNTYSGAVPTGTSAHSPEGLPESQVPTEVWLLQALGIVQTATEAAPVTAW